MITLLILSCPRELSLNQLFLYLSLSLTLSLSLSLTHTLYLYVLLSLSVGIVSRIAQETTFVLVICRLAPKPGVSGIVAIRVVRSPAGILFGIPFRDCYGRVRVSLHTEHGFQRLITAAYSLNIKIHII